MHVGLYGTNVYELSFEDNTFYFSGYVWMRWKGDLIGVPGVHVEVKRCERAQIWDWIKQAEKDCERGDIPAVHFRRNRSDWYVSVPLEAFIELLKKRDES